MKLSSKEYYADQGLDQRKALQRQWTEPLEGVIRAERENLNNIGPSNPDFVLFTLFSLNFFMQKIVLYAQHKITRLDFDAHIARQEAISKMVQKFCPRGKRTLVFMGDAFEPRNSPIKGYVIILFN